MLVTSLVIAFIIVGVAIGAMRVTGGMRVDRSRKEMATTFANVFERQGHFRVINGRFADWSELAKRGARLAPTQEVVGSRASASHWFLSLRDTTTGILCSRTGELMDEGPMQRQPACSDPTR